MATSNAPVWKLGAGSPLFTVFGVVRLPYIRKLPDSSFRAVATTLPQLAVGAGNVIALGFCVAPEVPLEAAAGVPPCVASQAVSDVVIWTGAYEPPETSV